MFVECKILEETEQYYKVVYLNSPHYWPGSQIGGFVPRSEVIERDELGLWINTKWLEATGVIEWSNDNCLGLLLDD